MKKLLLQLDSDPLPSAFDRIVGHDAGADDVLSYGGVGLDDVEALVHGAIFTRGPADLKNTAVFVGGSDIGVGEELLERAREAFFGPFSVSLMLDSNGSNTTAVGAVEKLKRAAGDVEGKRVVIAAGTGPVGMRAAGLFAAEGARVTVTSRDREKAGRAVDGVERRFDHTIDAEVVKYPLRAGGLLDGADILLSSGPPGVRLVERSAWEGDGGPTLLGDVNAVPPPGIEGVETGDDGEEREGARTFGAIGIGNFKMKLHKACIRKLFETNDLVLDAEEIYEVARTL